MRKIVGALVLLVLAVIPRADEISHRWIPIRRDARPTAAPVDSSDSVRPKAHRKRTREAAPPDYLRNPLFFLSTAPRDSLVLLPGVGPVLAERIVNARTGKRSFTRWDDLLAIKGIGPKTIERLKRLTDGTNSR